MLALLSLGPAYGSQLYAEFTSRTPHRSQVNVGQIYATLDRLRGRELVVAAGTTPDGLPLYELTPTGSTRVEQWLRQPQLDALPDWTDMLDHVLIALTIDSAAGRDLAPGYREWWVARLAELRAEAKADETDTVRKLSSLAAQAQATAAVSWLDSVAESTAGTETFRPYAESKPRRGRPRDR